jgi:hypothetical protein
MLAPILRDLDFVSPAGKLVSGLVSVRDGQEAVQRLDERLAVRDAIAIKDIDYVFFRRFSDDRGSQVVAYIVDNSDNRYNDKALAELHKRVWLHGGVPLVYVAWPTRVDILSCARGPDFWHDDKYEYKAAEQIHLAINEASAANQALHARYSAWRLVDGTFWDDPRNASLANSKERAHERLIAAVVETDEALKGEQNPLLRRLLLLTVLIKYLEDRRVFPSGWFGGFCKGAKSFFEALRDGDPNETIRLLGNLEKRFNGDIFSLTTEAARMMTKSVLKHFADLVEAKTFRRQRYLWEQFSFEHIPVEIVSHLYQRFVKGGHGTVYTPPFLASLLLDHAMPYDKLRGDERILDPACGSGVFLVGAFRRLINFHRSRNKWKPLDVDGLKSILRRSVFGVELDPGAVDLTTFSLALAVCDALKPEVIWESLKFDKLRGQNLVEGDFFAELAKAESGASTICNENFDVILGNPPFESHLTSHGRACDSAVKAARGDLPDKQAAYLFLEQGIRLLTPRGVLCLVQPSGILYNRKAYKFRREILKSATVQAILDFTSIRNLYESADPKTVAFVVVKAKPSEAHHLLHMTLRRTFGAKERIAFEIDHYDCHVVPQSVAVQDEFIWRLNLLGGGRLVQLSRRLRGMDTLKDFIDRNKLMYSEGFIIGSGGDTPASFLTGMTYLPAEALTDDGVDAHRLSTVTATSFHTETKESLYDPPLVLIRKNERLPLAYWNGGRLAFTSTIIGIGRGKASQATLKKIYSRLRDHHSTYRLSCAMHGSKAFVAKATAILKQDIDSLPFPAKDSDLSLSFWERVIEEDTLEYFCDFVRLGQNSALLRKQATSETVSDYSKLLCKLLKSVYSNFQSGSPVFLDGLICQPFYFGDSSKDDVVHHRHGDALRSLIYHKHHDSLRTVRMLRFYVDNVMLIVKPDRLRFWICSTAIRDADETIISLREQGY